MRRILDRLPTTQDLYRHRAKFAGFAAGIAVPLAVAAVFTVSWQGHGLWVDPPVPSVVYPGF
jgi:hypothetical protein